MKVYRSKSFSEKELRCRCIKCQGNVPHQIDPKALEKLQELRDKIGRPLILSSAYRCSEHPKERTKDKSGTHNSCAFDIKVNHGAEAYEIMKLAFELGFTGIAYGRGFVHVDTREDIPVTWRY